nr:YqzE family protein [Bacillus subtilis]
MTQQFVKYIDTPRDERKERKEVRKETKTPVFQQWFGILPYGFRLWLKRKK